MHLNFSYNGASIIVVCKIQLHNWVIENSPFTILLLKTIINFHYEIGITWILGSLGK